LRSPVRAILSELEGSMRDMKIYRSSLEAGFDRMETEFRKHEQYLVDPPTEFVKAKAEVFQVAPDVIDAALPIFYCGHPELPVLDLNPKKKYGPPTVIDPVAYTHAVAVKSLDHLKNLVGVPGSTQRARAKLNVAQRLPACTQIELRDLPATKCIELDSLDARQRLAVHRLGAALLHGPVDDAALELQPYAAVVRYLLARASALPTFVGSDLIVCPHHTVRFTQYAAVYFNNVIVYAGGKIHLGNNTKLHAYQIRHV